MGDAPKAFPARYRLLDAGGHPLEEGDCSVTIAGGAVEAAPRAGAAMRFPFTEIARWQAGDYALTLSLTTGPERVVLDRLGRGYEELLAVLREQRRDHLYRALLLDELGGGGAVAVERGEFVLRAPGGAPVRGDACELRMQATSMAVLPDVELPFVVPYGQVASLAFDPAMYGTRLVLANGHALDLVKAARRTDALRAELEERLASLATRTVQALQALAPGLGALAVRHLAAVLRDGVVATREQIEAAVPGAWSALWEHGMLVGDGGTGGASPRRRSAEWIASRAGGALLAVKEIGSPPDEGDAGEGGAAGEQAPSIALEHGRQMVYVFVLGRALVVEVPSQSGRATYVFRAGGDPVAGAAALVEAFAAVSFRREPIYLPDAALETGPHRRYAEAARVVPALAVTRKAFLGRAVHGDFDAWSRQVEGLAAQA